MAGIFLPGTSKGGDITGVTAGVGLSGGGSSCDLTVTLDLSELSAVVPTSGDWFGTLDSDDANEQLTTTDALATLFAGTGLTAASAVIGVDAAQTQITSVGTIATGTWEATDVGVAHGGTGASTLTANGVLIGNGTSAITSVAMATKGHILIGDGSGNPKMLGVGSNDQVLVADSGETTGVKWAAAASSATALDDIATGDGAASLVTTVGNITIDAQANDADVIIKVDDAGAAITAVTFDGSDAGNALFVNDIKLNSDSAVLSLGADDDATLTHDGTTGLTVAANPFEVDSGGNITLDAHTGIFIFQDANTEVLRITEGNSGDVTIKLETNAKDLIFTDNGDATGLTIKDAAAGIVVPGEVMTTKISFTDGDDAMTIADGGGVTFPVSIDITGSAGIILENDETITNSTNGTISFSGGIAVPDAGNIGSASDLDAIAISSGGVVTFSQSVDHALDAHFDSSPADETVSGITATFTAGEDLVRGEVVYFKAGDSKMWKAVASAAGTMPVAAMAAADISADAAGKFLLFGFLQDNGTFPSYTVGADLYAPEAETSSENVPEEAAPDSDGDFVQLVGYAVTANSVFFNPDQTIIEHA